MNNAPEFSKCCYRCPAVVRMSPEQFRADPNEHTICAVCRDKLEIEAGFAGTPIPPPEDDESISKEKKSTD